MQRPEHLKPAQCNKVKAKHLKIIFTDTDINRWWWIGGGEGLACQVILETFSSPSSPIVTRGPDCAHIVPFCASPPPNRHLATQSSHHNSLAREPFSPQDAQHFRFFQFPIPNHNLYLSTTSHYGNQSVS